MRAPIYARVSGYIKDYKVDIGAQVKAGQVLADIETPDLDQQLTQARADLVTAQANEKLAKLTSDRWQTIVKTGAVAKQDADEKLGDYQAKQAMTAASKANVDRLLAMKGFARITAPFEASSPRVTPTSVRSSTSAAAPDRNYRRLRHAQAAHVRERAAELRADGALGHEGDDGRA